MRADRNPRRYERGTTLIEMSIALFILLVGVLALMRLQIWGLASTQGARAYTTAQEMARELATGLEQLDFDDTRLSAVGAGASAPAGFGSLRGVTSFAGVHATKTDTLPPGVRAEAEIEGGAGNPTYVRRWSVWDYKIDSEASSAKFIAVSVIYHERGIQTDRETVFLVQKSKAGTGFSNAAAFR